MCELIGVRQGHRKKGLPPNRVWVGDIAREMLDKHDAVYLRAGSGSESGWILDEDGAHCHR